MSIRPLNSIQVSRLLAFHHGSHFIGVHPIDQLPHLFSYKIIGTRYCFIVNTDPSTLPGTHWLAVYLGPRKMAEVFDSYGRPPPLRLQKWLTMYGYRWTYNKRFIQGPLSALCGVYCVFVLDQKCANPQLTLKDIIDEHFSEDASGNDIKMYRFYKTISHSM